jgi:hypothetical protein
MSTVLTYATFFSNFDHKLMTNKTLNIGQKYLVVQWDEEGVKMYGRLGTIVDIYPNYNTGNDVHVFEYEDTVFGPDDEMDGSNYWARQIIAYNSKYSLWFPGTENKKFMYKHSPSFDCSDLSEPYEEVEV